MVLTQTLDREPNIIHKLLKAELVDYLPSPICMKTPGGVLTVPLEEGVTYMEQEMIPVFYGVRKRENVLGRGKNLAQA